MILFIIITTSFLIIGLSLFYLRKKNLIVKFINRSSSTNSNKGYIYLYILFNLTPAIITISVALLLNNSLHYIISIFLLLILHYLSFKLSNKYLGNIFNSIKNIKFIEYILGLCALTSILITILVIASIIFQAIKFFNEIPILDFIFGTVWAPEIEETELSKGLYGALPLLLGTILITLISLVVAIFLGLFTAIFISEIAPKKVSIILKPTFELLSGIPTVVYGMFAAVTFAPLLQKFLKTFNINMNQQSALVPGIIIGIMITPMIISLIDDILKSIPKDLKYAALYLGSYKYQVILYIILPIIYPGIIAAIILAASRALGETMIVLMAAGLSAKLNANPLEATTTITVQIATILTGDQSFDSVRTLSAFALGIMLVIFTFILNTIAIRILDKKLI